jgi:hypothetical protein
MPEQKLVFRDDKLYIHTLLPQYGGDICREELIMTKEIFQACYKKWIKPQEGEE